MDDEDDVRYAMSGFPRLAFRIRGHGPHKIAWVPSWLSNLDAEPPSGAPSFTDPLSSFATVLSYDPRAAARGRLVSTDTITTNGKRIQLAPLRSLHLDRTRPERDPHLRYTR